jgi:hypothetical protein
MPSFIDKLSNIDRYRQTITIIVSSLIVLSITSLRDIGLDKAKCRALVVVHVVSHRFLNKSLCDSLDLVRIYRELASQSIDVQLLGDYQRRQWAATTSRGTRPWGR